MAAEEEAAGGGGWAAAELRMIWVGGGRRSDCRSREVGERWGEEWLGKGGEKNTTPSWFESLVWPDPPDAKRDGKMIARTSDSLEKEKAIGLYLWRRKLVMPGIFEAGLLRGKA
jgi:hypothetical protein